MKTIVLHGEDSVKSYDRLKRFLDEAKKRGWEVLFDQFPYTPSLFGKSRLTVYRDCKILTSSDIKNIPKYDGTLVIFHEDTLPQTFLKSLPKDTKIEEFKLPVLVWNFLDAITPGNPERLVKTLHAIISKEPIEFIFSMIARRIKELYWVSMDPESIGYPSWRLSKLKSQASKFKEDQLKELIETLARIDFESKTGQADLVSELDLTLLTKLQ
jgi:hypothetical protein